ncbi:MAG: FtsW/RodA/SpoVE family cell cycle protein, partial [Firmicutes bacterium]|nr:FtsW/RodA/SpoVE family cell cycle protein [Bacillota bacterium]
VTGGLLRLVPLTGLVTPFISYGGTAMVTNLFSLGLLLNISRQELWS